MIPRFWREISTRYNLIGMRCNNCNKLYFPSRSICPQCHRASIGKIETIKLSGRGKVLTYSTIYHAPQTLKLEVPYTIAIIELEEGVRITAQIVDCNPEDIKIGSKVRGTFRKLREDGDSGIIHYGYKFILDEAK